MNPRARARRTDPSTSHEAADYVNARDIASAQRHKCYQYVVLNPGCTAAEIAKALGLDRHAPSRRLPELRDCNPPKIENREMRICKVTGRRSLTWYPIAPDGNPRLF